MPNETELRNAIGKVVDPEIGRALGEVDMLGSVQLDDGGAARVEIRLPTHAYPKREQLAEAIRSAAESLPDVNKVEVDFTVDTKGKNTGGTIGLRVKNVIAVGSGKGGVGKSTVAACLAYGLKSYGARVGLMDADVYGPSIPHLVGVQDAKPAALEQKTAGGESVTRIEPVDADGVKVISMGFFVEPEKAVIWRGPLLHRAILQFLKDTDWGELDYLIIDLPPGTGDVSLTLSQSVGLAGAVVVCTPQKVALLDAVKAIAMFGQVNIPVLGVVENMTGEIFGRGGAKRTAEEMGVPFLGEIPTVADIRVKGDDGQIAQLFAEDNPARPPLLHVCEQTAMSIARSLLKSRDMPALEIL